MSSNLWARNRNKITMRSVERISNLLTSEEENVECNTAARCITTRSEREKKEIIFYLLYPSFYWTSIYRKMLLRNL